MASSKLYHASSYIYDTSQPPAWLAEFSPVHPQIIREGVASLIGYKHRTAARIVTSIRQPYVAINIGSTLHTIRIIVHDHTIYYIIILIYHASWLILC